MKKHVILFFSLLVAASSYAQQGFTLKIKLNNFKKYDPRLAYVVGEKLKVDSTYTLENGWLVMKGEVKSPVMASFTLKGNPALEITSTEKPVSAPSLYFFLTNDVITIKGDANSIYAAEVKGGAANADWADLRKKEQAIHHENWINTQQVVDSCKSCDYTTLMRAISKKNSPRNREIHDWENTFFKSHPNSPYSMYMLYRMQAMMEFDTLKSKYDGMGAAAKNNVYAKVISDRIASLEATAVGRAAIPIQKKDMNGQEVSLATLKGKYVLLDFWGSWCHPCRDSHPHLKELYSKYKDQGFEIVGIAEEMSRDLETSRKAWKEAVKTDGITWVSVLNNEGKDQFDAVNAYGINAFPTKLLLDKEGKIIGRWIGNEPTALDAKMKEVFGN